MLDEEMDDMIRRAAENHHPSYNDKAWEKMEMQLDKHLPQKKDRKKMVFFLLFFLLLGGGLFFTVNRFLVNKVQVAEKSPDKKSQDELTAQSLSNEPATEKNATLTPGTVNENEADGISGNQPGEDRSTNKQPADDPSANNQTAINKTTGNNPDDNKSVAPPPNVQQKNNSNNRDDNKTIARLNDQQRKQADNPDNNNLDRNKKFTKSSKGKTKINIAAAKPFEELTVEENVSTSTSKKKPIAGKTKGKLNVQVTAAEPVENTEEKSIAIAPNSTADKNVEDTTSETNVKTEQEKEIAKVKEEEKELAKTEEKSTDKKQDSAEKKTDRKFTSNFGLTFSVGPDVSFVSLNRFGKINLTYGAGISYNFAKRLTVRTGFYFTRKIYAASPEQYKTPGGNYPYLTGVDANCMVYEIPLSLAYSFGHRKKHNWFGNVGLSSFLMKNEKYDYNYKTPTGQTYNYKMEVSNQNKHYFSVLTLSGGYNYRFNKRVSIQAEPYLQVPLGGVGFGKIKLNSAGVLFTVNVKPFAKKK